MTNSFQLLPERCGFYLHLQLASIPAAPGPLDASNEDPKSEKRVRLESEYAVIDVRVVPDLFVIYSAACRALDAHRSSTQLSKSLLSELLFYLSPSNNIANAIRQVEYPSSLLQKDEGARALIEDFLLLATINQQSTFDFSCQSQAIVPLNVDLHEAILKYQDRSALSRLYNLGRGVASYDPHLHYSSCLLALTSKHI
jgi:hypothetical protein